MEGEITITITLKPSPRGYYLDVQSEPRDTYGDVLKEACQRAAAFIERQIMVGEILKALGRPPGPRIIG